MDNALLITGTAAIAIATVGCLLFIGLASLFDNHLWRLICCTVATTTFYNCYTVYCDNANASASANVVTTIASLLCMAAINYGIMFVPHCRPAHKRSGVVVITGCDSGMGQATAVYLCTTNAPPGSSSSNTNNKGRYDKIFAACFDPKAAQAKFDELIPNQEARQALQVIPLDATKDASVQQAAATVDAFLTQQQQQSTNTDATFLAAVLCYHGIAYNGPLSYMPLKLFQTQMEVNFFGTVRMVQAFLPLLRRPRSSSTTTGSTTAPFGRMIFTGTGGGPCTPCPPLLSAYMCSKFALEAMAQSLKQELFMTHTKGGGGTNSACEPVIDVSVINPGFVKPTQLMADGIKLSETMWKLCEDQQGSSIAKDTYGPMMDHFHTYAALQPGTHVREVCYAAEHALTSYAPRSSYKVGIDSKLAPIAGMLPTGVREWVARHGIYGILSPAKTVPGYQV